MTDGESKHRDAEVRDWYRRQALTPEDVATLFDRLAEDVAGSLGERHTFIADRVFRGAIQNLVEAGDHYRAAQVTEKWYSWLADVGALRVSRRG